ncbi:MAG TPA: SdrD B-like domain-containing protein, partial [Dongiaceae bacterium]|nr:SdrD B-like domain-containing protein [Dongiaceae bacterium]
GRAYLYLGSASGPGPGPVWTGESDQAYAFFGTSVAGAGDVNGDGFSDIIIGAYAYDNGQEDEGRAFLYYGNGGPGLSLVPRQNRSDDFAPVAPLGLSDSRESFRLSTRGRTPYGRGLVKLEREVKPFGTLFDGTATETSTGWVDIGTAGVTFDELVGGLAGETLYHWRARLRYHPATTPYQVSSRWFTAAVNGWQEADLRTPAVDHPLPRSPGDRAWLDADGDGIQDPGEPGMPNVVVSLYDGAGVLLESTVTDASGNYLFSDRPLGATYRVRFTPPAGYMLTSKDQGTNDALDSDAEPGTEFTPDFVLESPQDGFRWDAGFFASCLPPDKAIFINRVTLTTDGNQNPIVHFQDSNLLSQVTGYNVHRSSSRFPPPSNWPLVASNVLDMDAVTPNNQWVDTSGDVAPGGIWYYQVTAFNSRCPAEGPF